MKRCRPLGWNSSKLKQSKKGSNQQLLKSERRSSSWLLHTFGRSVPGYGKRMQLPQEPLNKRPRGLARKSMAGTNFAELYGGAIVNSSCEGNKGTSREHIAWF